MTLLSRRRRRVRHRALRAALSTAQREEALQRRRERLRVKRQRRGRFVEESVNGGIESTENAVTIHKSQGLTPDPRRSSHL